MRVPLTVMTLFGLAACSPQQCDPSQAGFFSGIGCAASGSYAARNQYQQSELAQQNTAASQNRAQAQDEGARASQALLTRDQARRRLGAVDQQTAQLRTRLNAARARGDISQIRLSDAQTELDALQRERAGLRGAATDEQVRALEDHERRVRDQLTGV